jgi:dihydrodipicolinate synthase/N-acetylneuraminate lyase
LDAPSTIHGVVCPIVTPFDASGRVDLAATREVLDFVISRGVHAVFPAGTTGEGLSLTLEEREALCTAAVEHVAGRIPVIMHTGCITTADTIELTRHARSVGATAVAIIPPFFYTFDDESLASHMLSVALAVPDLPIFLYAFPENAKNDISPALLKRLLEGAPNIVGIKVSSGNLLRMQEYIRIGGNGFAVLCGMDGLMLAALSVGACGQVSSHANAFAEPYLALYDAFMVGNWALARQQQQLIDQVRLVLQDGLHPAYFKAALSLRGVPGGRVRPPMREIGPEELQAMTQGLRELGLLPSQAEQERPMR